MYKRQALVSARSYAVAPPVVINEVLAGNATTNLDPAYTNYSPWIELYNAGGSAVNLGGYRLSDDVANPAGYALPANTTIAAGGRLIIWYDELATGLHTSYSLDTVSYTHLPGGLPPRRRCLRLPGRRDHRPR